MTSSSSVPPTLTRPLSTLHRPLPQWGLAWLVTMVLYAFAWRAGFVYDFLGYPVYFEENSFPDSLNSRDINNDSLYHATQLQMLVFIRLFGLSPLPWFLIATALHALNAVLLFRLMRGLCADLSIQHPVHLAGGAALLALLFPAAHEAVVYKAAYHYLPGVAAILGILLLARQALITGRTKPAWMSIALFALTTFSLEIFYTTPWLMLCMATALFWSSRISAAGFRRGMMRMFLPMLLLFAAHLLLVRVTSGSWIAHDSYDSSGAISPAGWLGRIWAYEHELLFLGRYHPVPVRQAIGEASRWAPAGWALGVALVALAGFMLVRFRKASPLFRLWVLLTAWAFISLAIVLHYMLDELLLGVNDRLLYFTSFFHCALISLAIYTLARRVRGFATGIAIVASVYAFTTFYTVWQWFRSTQVLEGLVSSFPADHKGVILILNGPLNYKGIPMVASYDESGWPEHVRLRTGRRVRGKVYDVSSYNMSRWWDGASVERVADSTVKVTLNQWGTWWWWQTFGATDRDHPLFKLRMTDAGHQYHLDLKVAPRDVLLLVQEERRWKRVRLE